MVVHKFNDNTYILGSVFAWNEIVYNTTGGSTNYANSLLREHCAQYQSSIASDSLALAINTTVNGVTDKVFIPSREQCEGEFEWFSLGAKRVAYAGNSISWWTSSSYSSTRSYYVDSNGGISHINIDGREGFRPFITISI